MRTAGNGIHGTGIRALVVILWRVWPADQRGALAIRDRHGPRRGSIVVRRGRDGKRRVVGMNGWGWEHVKAWRRIRYQLPLGPFLCVVDGPTRGRAWSETGARAELRRLAAVAGVRRRFAPHQLRHAHAVEMVREEVPRPVIQRQLGHAHLGVTSTYLQGIDTAEIIDTIHGRRPP